MGQLSLLLWSHRRREGHRRWRRKDVDEAKTGEEVLHLETLGITIFGILVQDHHGALHGEGVGVWK